MTTPPLRSSLAYRTYRLQRLLRRQFLSLAEQAGFRLTPEQFFLLDKLVRLDGQTQTELADDALQDKPNLTRMVRELEQRGLLARRPDPEDGRKKRVHLTAAGAELYEAFHARVVIPGRVGLFTGLDPATLDAAHAVFDHLENQLQ
jgi:MarR family transcriptional regulator for hemolysin